MGLVIILLLVLLVRWVVISRRLQGINRRIEKIAAVRGDEQFEERLRELDERVHRLEAKIEKIGKAVTPESVSPSSGFTEAAPPETLIEETKPAAENKPRLPPSPVVPPPPVIPPAPVMPAERSIPPASDTRGRIADLKGRASEPIQATPHALPSQPSVLNAWIQRTREQMGGEEWETIIGGNWLNKIGTVVLVIGVALFLGYSLRYMGPLGKVATGLGSSLFLLIGGVILERAEKYTFFAKPLIGGGWALLYFTAYASHNIDAAKVIEDSVIGFLLLGLIASGMVLHSLKYRSEVVTGMAYLLGFLTVSISPLSGFSLIASALLAGSLVIIMRAMRWQNLGLFGLAATYLNHLLWLEYRMGGKDYLIHGQSFWLAQGMLTLYWIIFTALALVLKSENEKQEQTALVTNVANTVVFLVLSLRQIGIFYPEGIYLLTGFAGIAYAVTSYLMRLMHKRKLCLVNGTVAVVLIAFTFPLMPESFPLSRDWLAIAWLGEAWVALALGFNLKEIVFRLQAYLLVFVAVVAVFGINLYGWPEMAYLSRWFTILPVIAYLYYLFGQLNKRWRLQEVSKLERNVGVLSVYAGTGLMAALLWNQLNANFVGLAWLGAGVVLLEAGIRAQQTPYWRAHIRNQGYVLSALAVAAFFLFNLLAAEGPESVHPPSLWITVLPAIFAFYALFTRLYQAANQGKIEHEEKSLADLSSYAASGLVVVLLWVEVRPELVALAWLVSAILLLEAGIRFRQEPLRTQGYILSALALSAFVLINLYGFYGEQALRGPSRWLTVLPAVFAFYGLFLRLRQAATQRQIEDEERCLADIASYLASALFTVFLWKELDEAAVALAWGFLGVLLFEAGTGLKQSALRRQAHIMAVLAFGRLFLANFTAPGEIFGLSHRLITVAPVVAMFYYLRSRIAEEQDGGMGFHFERHLPRVYSYAAALLLVILARFEFGRSLAVMAWGVMTLVFLILGISSRNRDFRIQSCLIGVLTFWRSWSTNFYLVGSYYGIPERIATTVPVIAAFYAAKALCLFKHDFFSEVETGKVPSLIAKVETNPHILFSILASLLLTLLLYFEVQGNLLTIAWAIEGFGLLAIGFLIPERTFRLSGLSLLMVCLVKVFLIDLQGVETIYRIFSFIVLGIMLVLVSFGYTKYRDVIKRYM
jgi:uncharacterized membrane protein